MDVFHDYHGHQGTAVLTFRNDIHGLEDAQAFARSFAAVNRGSKEWWGEKRPDSLDLYGWQATEGVSILLAHSDCEYHIWMDVFGVMYIERFRSSLTLSKSLLPMKREIVLPLNLLVI